jgi:hypothetical protein
MSSTMVNTELTSQQSHFTVGHASAPYEAETSAGMSNDSAPEEVALFEKDKSSLSLGHGHEESNAVHDQGKLSIFQ